MPLIAEIIQSRKALGLAAWLVSVICLPFFVAYLCVSSVIDRIKEKKWNR